jgi:hypothetical protein
MNGLGQIRWRCEINRGMELEDTAESHQSVDSAILGGKGSIVHKQILLTHEIIK